MRILKIIVDFEEMGILKKWGFWKKNGDFEKKKNFENWNLKKWEF